MQVGNVAGLVPYDPNFARYSQTQPGFNLQDMMGAMGRQAQVLQRSIVNNPMRYGMLAGIPTAMSELDEGRTVGALGAVGGSAVGALGAGALARGALGAVAQTKTPLGIAAKIGMAAAPLLGGMIGAQPGAQAAEYAKRKITNEPTRGKEGELGSVLAAREKIGQQDLSMLERTLGVNTSNIKDLTQFYMNAEREQMQKMNPLIQKMKNADLVRQQAMANTMAGNYAMLGTVATAGKLATGAQEQTGANLRTALSSNPYAGSVMQAPNISFG